MTTSEDSRASVVVPVQGVPVLGNWGTVLHGIEGLPAGLPDPAELARMAGEFFTALPGVPETVGSSPHAGLRPGAPADMNPYAALPSPTLPAAPLGTFAAVDPPFGGAPRFGQSGAIPPGGGLAPQATPPAVPGLGQAAEPASPTSFLFLQEARPIFSEPSGAAPQAAPEAGAIPAAPIAPESTSPRSIFGDASLDAIPTYVEADNFPGQLVNLSQLQPPTPTIPGSLGAFDTPATPSFSFLEEARPLFSNSPIVSGPVPSGVAHNAPSRDLRSPQVSGSVPRQEAGVADGYDFIGQTRSLGGIDTVPVLEPVNTTRDVPGELNLSSYPFDVESIRRDFPILQERVNGRPLIWFDNAATTQKPQNVIDRLSYFYEHENSNVHRAAHELAARATDAYESAREKTRRFLNAGSINEIIFVRGATEGINLVAQSWGRRNVQKDDEIVVSWLEHHANIVPWQMLCAEKGARLRVAPVDDSGQIILDEYEKLLGPKTRIVSISQVSNALGTITPVKEMIEAAHRHGARVLVDGAQSVSHMRTDVQALDCDFFVLSGHKLFAPTGIGVVFGKAEVLDSMPPWQGGGNMIQDVTFEKTAYQPSPQRFEAGTGNIADAVGLGAAIDYLDRVGMANISNYEHGLLAYATAGLQRIPGLHIIGTAKEKASVISFVLDGFQTAEIGEYLNRKGIAVRGGHHCAQPVLRRFGLESTLRVSLAFYNTCEEVDALIAALWDLRQGRNPGPA
jgi:cysteine desulfurase/selenocysteine lyase